MKEMPMVDVMDGEMKLEGGRYVVLLRSGVKRTARMEILTCVRAGPEPLAISRVGNVVTIREAGDEEEDYKAGVS